ncbi:hypothetical protein [Kordia sp.]|uniref:hypothetical protein n=1 Tax=Kordia sp. TaxID=1965332 RepID=UPI003B5BCB02
MKSFKVIIPKKFYNTSNYQCVEDKIYNDLNDIDGFSTYRIAIAIKNTQETICPKKIDKQLESYFVYIEEDLGLTETTNQKFILGGELEDLQKFLMLMS